MARDLFSKPPRYTIDSSSLIDIFADEKMVSKNITPGLWANIETLIREGGIISHITVLQEIKREETKGEELYSWAQANADIFQDYDWEPEGRINKRMSPKYSAFVNATMNHIYADPWL